MTEYRQTPTTPSSWPAGPKDQALYVLLTKSHDPLSRLIQWQTRGPYGHAALVNHAGDLIEALQGAGVIHDSIKKYPRSDYDLFRVVPLINTRQKYYDPLKGWNFAEDQIGKPYDYTMVVRFVTRQQETRETSGKWFCSELVFAALQRAGLPLLERTDPWEVSPAMLARSPYLIKVPGISNE